MATGAGARDPVVVTRDLLDYVHAASRVKAVGTGADLGEAADTVQRLAAIAESQSLAQLTRLWKILLTALDDVRTAPDPLAAAEMTLLRLVAASMLPPPEDAARLLASQPPAPADREAPGKSEPAALPAGAEAALDIEPEAADTPDLQQGPDTFEALIAMLQDRRDIILQLDVERFIRPSP